MESEICRTIRVCQQNCDKEKAPRKGPFQFKEKLGLAVLLLAALVHPPLDYRFLLT